MRLGTGQIGIKRNGLWPAFLVDLIFGITIGPCTFAYMAPRLAAMLRAASTHYGAGSVLLIAYAVCPCSVIALAGASTGLVQRYFNWNERSKGAIISKRICGSLVLLAGLYLIYIAR